WGSWIGHDGTCVRDHVTCYRLATHRHPRSLLHLAGRPPGVFGQRREVVLDQLRVPGHELLPVVLCELLPLAGGKVPPDLLYHVPVARQCPPGRRALGATASGRPAARGVLVLLCGRPAARRVLVFLLLALRRSGRLFPGTLRLRLRLLPLRLLRPAPRP